jgi:hypothetical protein
MPSAKPDDIIEGPDANQVRRHAKRMLTEREYRLKYRKFDFYRPNPFQLKLHNAPLDARLINARGSNQMGKSLGAAMQLTMDALGSYPSWYAGRRFLVPPKIIRPFAFQALIASNTSLVLRDGLAKALLGDLSQNDGLGTGALPLDAIVGKPTMSRGIADFFDTVTLNREAGGQAIIGTRSYDAGRRVWQGTAQDEVFLDEDDDQLADQFGEIWARLTTTRGRVIMTATAIIGLTYMQKLFEENPAQHPERHLIVGDLKEADHLTEQDKKDMEAGYREDEREARVHGGIRMGTGAAFAFNRADITCQIEPRAQPSHSCFLWGTDLAHSSGPTAHPFAAVLLMWNRDTDVVTVCDAFEMRGQLSAAHVERIKGTFAGTAKVAYPKDGSRHDLNSGDTLIEAYRSKGNITRLNVLPEHSTFPDGSVSLEACVTAIQERLSTGRLRVQSHLTEFLTQLANYHRDIDGRLVPQDDDMVSALFCGIRSLRFAKPLSETAGVRFEPAQTYDGHDPRFARGAGPNEDWDIFTGR